MCILALFRGPDRSPLFVLRAKAAIAGNVHPKPHLRTDGRIDSLFHKFNVDNSMPTRSADATWNGNLPDGNGTMYMESGSYEGAYSYRSRFENGDGTNPEELIAAAQAGCYSMALSNVLDEEGYDPQTVDTTAEVTLRILEDGPAITKVHLTSEANVPEIDNDTFQDLADAAKSGCPVSNALAGAEITLDATLNQ